MAAALACNDTMGSQPAGSRFCITCQAVYRMKATEDGVQEKNAGHAVDRHVGQTAMTL